MATITKILAKPEGTSRTPDSGSDKPLLACKGRIPSDLGSKTSACASGARAGARHWRFR